MISFLIALGLLAPQAAAKPAPAPAAKPAVPVGWVFKESSDPAAPKSASATIRSKDGNARLIVRCDTADHPIISVQFIPTPRLAAGDARTVQVMLDHGFADMATWQFPGAGAYNGEPPEVFLLSGEIAKAKEIGISFDDGAGNTVGADFAGPGDDKLFRQVYAACGLPYQMPDPNSEASKG